MRVTIVNDNQNWLHRGTLVQIWIAEPNRRPTTVKARSTKLLPNSGTDTEPRADIRSAKS
jgi:hypothetical protein